MANAEDEVQTLREKVGHYESKLATLTVMNGALQSEIDELRERIDEDEQPDNEEEVKELQEEFATRLAASENMVASLKQERDLLRRQLAHSNQGGNAHAEALAEKDKAVEEYKFEGEKLARKVGELEGIIKKLRVAAKESETGKDKLVKQLQMSEANLQTSLQAKQAAAEELKLELRTVQEAMALQEVQFGEQLTATKRESQEVAEVEHARRKEVDMSKAADAREASLSAEVARLQEALAIAQQQAADREGHLRQEVQQLESRCRALDKEVDALNEAKMEASVPLLRQVEALAAQAANFKGSSEGVERSFNVKLQAAHNDIARVKERNVRPQHVHAAQAAAEAAKHGATQLAAQVSQLHARIEEMQRQSTSLELKLESATQALESAQGAGEREKAGAAAEKEQLLARVSELQEALELEKDTRLALERAQRAQAAETAPEQKATAPSTPQVQVRTAFPETLVLY
ncbi:hypothetical protein CYMTET_51923, partial [Cymbomonas tetramitiformis]